MWQKYERLSLIPIWSPIPYWEKRLKWILDISGRLRCLEHPKKAWVFIIFLSYSRYMYVDIILDHNVGTSIRYHTNTFRYFSDVPKTVKIDNLSGHCRDRFLQIDCAEDLCCIYRSLRFPSYPLPGLHSYRYGKSRVQCKVYLG